MPRRNKYNVAPKEERTVGNHVFASKKEANRYRELKLLNRAGKIINLQLQPKFEISINGVHVCNYFGDFAYLDVERGAQEIVEDTKGVKTAVYKLKKKLVKAVYGIDIKEI